MCFSNLACLCVCVIYSVCVCFSLIIGRVCAFSVSVRMLFVVLKDFLCMSVCVFIVLGEICVFAFVLVCVYVCG